MASKWSLNDTAALGPWTQRGEAVVFGISEVEAPSRPRPDLVQTPSSAGGSWYYHVSYQGDQGEGGKRNGPHKLKG